MPFDTIRPYDSFVKGQQNAMQREYAGSRNALAQMEVEQAPRDIANRNALAERQQQQYSQEQVQRALQQTAAGAMRIAQSENPQAEAAQAYPEFAAKLREQNPDWDRLPPEEARQYAGWIAGQAQSKLGIAPAPKVKTIGDTADPGAGILQEDPTTGVLKQVVAPQKPDNFAAAEAGRNARAAARPVKPASQYRAMSAEEVAAAGLPVGSSAQVDDATGKIDVLSKRDQTATLSQKDQTTARMKLNSVKLARQQLNKIKSTFEEGREGMNAFGPGQGMLPTQAGKKFDATVDQMRSTLTALTRVPGVGAMSDYETKLDQSKFPKRGDYESVTAEKIQGIEDMLATIESGYTDLLGGQQATPEQPQQGQAPQQAIEYLKANPQFRGAFRQKYGYLPDGI